MKVETDFGGRSFIGARATQQDYYAFCAASGPEDDPDKLLVVVADGMGGHEGGAQASRIAVEAFIQEFQAFPCNATSEDGPALRESLLTANARVGELAPGFDQVVGTTLVAASITRRTLQWISVGDSPLHLLRGGQLRRMNEDHSMRPVFAEKLASGELTPEEASSHAGRNELRSALTGDPPDLIDLPQRPTKLKKGDVILLATDGLDCLKPEEVASTCASWRGEGAGAIARELIESVRKLERKGQDNATVALMIT